jgi:hypothetical protein
MYEAKKANKLARGESLVRPRPTKDNKAPQNDDLASLQRVTEPPVPELAAVCE